MVNQGDAHSNATPWTPADHFLILIYMTSQKECFSLQILPSWNLFDNMVAQRKKGPYRFGHLVQSETNHNMFALK